MPATIQLYNHTVNRFNQGLNAATDTYKVVLLSDLASFGASHTTLSQVTNAGAYEVYGGGWPQGGYTLTNVGLIIADTDGGKFSADNVAQEITVTNLGPYSKYVIVNVTDADSPPVAFITMENALTVTVGNIAAINWNAAGIITWTVV
jgi:hypothetical protein